MVRGLGEVGVKETNFLGTDKDDILVHIKMVPI